MFLKKFHICIFILLSGMAFSSCTSFQRLPGETTEEAAIYIKRCGTCHAVPHPSRLKVNHWEDKIVVMKGLQMPVITSKEKKEIISYIKHPSEKNRKLYNLRCGKCHIPPDTQKLNPDEWEERIVVLDGNMPVFSEQERVSVIKYLHTFTKKDNAASDAHTLQTLGFKLPKIRNASPGFTLKDIEEKEISLKKMNDKIVILHFWAPWCKPCYKELPALQSFWNKLRDENVQVLGIIPDKSVVTKIKDIIARQGITFPTLLDSEGKVQRAYLVEAFPTTYIVGKDGKLSAKVVGAINWRNDILIQHIRKLAKE